MLVEPRHGLELRGSYAQRGPPLLAEKPPRDEYDHSHARGFVAAGSVVSSLADRFLGRPVHDVHLEGFPAVEMVQSSAGSGPSKITQPRVCRIAAHALRLH